MKTATSLSKWSVNQNTVSLVFMVEALPEECAAPLEMLIVSARIARKNTGSL